MRYRFQLLVLCLASALPAHAERYSSYGEAFIFGGLQGLFFTFMFWLMGRNKRRKSKKKEMQPQNIKIATSEVVQPNKIVRQSLSPWEKYRVENADIAKILESQTNEDLQYLSEKDIIEKVATFMRMSRRFKCPVSELKDVTVRMFVSKFNKEELRDVVDRLTVKSEIESREYCISEENTMSYYVQIWLSDYLYNTSNLQ